MADYSITAVDRRVVYDGSAGTGPYAFSFPILTTTDIAVFKDSTRLTEGSGSSQYQVTISSSNGTGSVTLGSAASASNTITITGARTIERTTDFVTAGDLLASSLNVELDSQTIFAQQVSEDAARAIRAPVTDPTSINMELPAKADRADNLLSFNSSGDPTVTSVSGLATVAASLQRTVDVFSGNGSTTSFTLSVAPGREENCQVFFDGVHQAHSTFTVSNTTLAFSTAPPSGTNNIEVVHGAALAEAGPQGATGSQGPAGPQGPRGQGGVEYNFESTTTDTDQGAGKVFLNNSTVASASVLYLDDLDANGVNLNTFIDTFDDSSTTSYRGSIHLVEIADPSNYAIFAVNGSVISASTYSKIPVAHQASGGSFTDGNAMSVLFVRTGDTGSGLASVVADTTPQLGGDLDMNGKNIDFPTTANVSDVLNESNMASNSSTKLATQSSIKAYADLKATKGANSDITSLSGLTTALSVAQGGTGATSLTDGGVLLGSGTGAISAMSALGDGHIIVGDGSGDPVALSAFSSSTGNLLGTKGGVIGQQTIWVPAGAMEPAVSTAPAVSNAVEIGTSLFAARTMDFADGSDLYCYFGIQMPKSWDAGNLVLQFVWSATGTNANTVAWGAAAISLADDEALTTAFPAPTVATADTNSTTADDLMISAEVSLTVGSSPAAENYVMFEIMRDVSADTLAEAARLHGIRIHYTVNTGIDT
ncbi:MAG: hypothetical protein CMC70_06580 [Flavobacteriaceae bacterium]|nr:hypothetical protein [Flavobacteriaceae bacterium]|tara:strand:- start:202 stop:2328 length:2127 start_codon:yes stop_codon:yes gene_type:complete